MKRVIISYSDVCKDNVVYKQLKEFFELTPLDHEFSYGYSKTMINGVEFNISVDRHQTHAGNQYIRVYALRAKEIKIPMGVEICIDTIKAKLEKIAEQVKKDTAENGVKQQYRDRVYSKFAEINIDNKLRLNVSYDNIITVSGVYSSYYQYSIAHSTLEKDIAEIREYFTNYEREQAEIKRLVDILTMVK